MCKLALVTVLAHTIFLIRTTEFRLVATSGALALLGFRVLAIERPAFRRAALPHHYLDGGSLRSADGTAG